MTARRPPLDDATVSALLVNYVLCVGIFCTSLLLGVLERWPAALVFAALAGLVATIIAVMLCVDAFRCNRQGGGA